MMRTSQIIFQNKAGMDKTVYSEAVRADLWYGSADHIYTIAIHGSAFEGVVQIQGTVVAVPQALDWFPIGEAISFNSVQGMASNGFSFSGLYTWIRVLIDGKMGYIDRVLINQ